MAYRGITILTPPLERLGPRLSTCSTAAARNLRRRVGVSLHPRTGCRQASCGMPTASLRSGLSSSVEGEPRPCPAPWERRSISHICHGQQPRGRPEPFCEFVSSGCRRATCTQGWMRGQGKKT